MLKYKGLNMSASSHEILALPQQAQAISLEKKQLQLKINRLQAQLARQLGHHPQDKQLLALNEKLVGIDFDLRQITESLEDDDAIYAMIEKTLQQLCERLDEVQRTLAQWVASELTS